MKNFRNLWMFASIVIGLLILISCEKGNEELLEEQDLEFNTASPSENAVLPNEVVQKSVEVARIHKDGLEYRFISIGDEGDMLVREISKDDTSNKTNISQGDNPLNIFLKITKDHVSIPKSISKTGSLSTLMNSGRKIMDYDVPINDGISSNRIVQKTPVKSIFVSCSEDVGQTTFETVSCLSPVVSTATNIEYCDQGLHTTLTRDTRFAGIWRDSDLVTTITNFCGDTRIQFYSWTSSGWVLNIQYDYFTDGTETNQYFSSSNTERKVVRTTLGSGSFRAFTRFNNIFP